VQQKRWVGLVAKTGFPQKRCEKERFVEKRKFWPEREVGAFFLGGKSGLVLLCLEGEEFSFETEGSKVVRQKKKRQRGKQHFDSMVTCNGKNKKGLLSK